MIAPQCKEERIKKAIRVFLLDITDRKDKSFTAPDIASRSNCTPREISSFLKNNPTKYTTFVTRDGSHHKRWIVI